MCIFGTFTSCICPRWRLEFKNVQVNSHLIYRTPFCTPICFKAELGKFPSDWYPQCLHANSLMNYGNIRNSIFRVRKFALSNRYWVEWKGDSGLNSSGFYAVNYSRNEARKDLRLQNNSSSHYAKFFIWQKSKKWYEYKWQKILKFKFLNMLFIILNFCHFNKIFVFCLVLAEFQIMDFETWQN